MSATDVLIRHQVTTAAAAGDVFRVLTVPAHMHGHPTRFELRIEARAATANSSAMLWPPREINTAGPNNDVAFGMNATGVWGSSVQAAVAAPSASFLQASKFYLVAAVWSGV